MDRLTRRTDLGATFGRYSYLSDLELKRAAEQLAAYEDTGLMPEEIERLKKSDASKEQSSVNYYSEAKQLRSEVAALKAENERLKDENASMRLDIAEYWEKERKRHAEHIAAVEAFDKQVKAIADFEALTVKPMYFCAKCGKELNIIARLGEEATDEQKD